ncbi:CDP-diacylglycerol--glycerol-3-phosphate 3-phosphatidyltransferase [Anaerococcus sp. AGMB00486]|uniref:CDP-diacylglycerol--glycerol-3-phosphate 3-phosphatidyltransferase n=1 Tax=Anaerococcus faecalis TaxID=2742993 RepID=A0ABX2N8G4_9FIRM|nr:CDP-diacylglycerol--glycerol-3-phosphate 3-phosphatidyltransferase [Anaerococcus faecalis]NVF10965.1 CDP-diacylglycerol--glycerol-3-phosphate 3-phosphatidyltransferase [Anaerococcus faecalis]
MNIANKVTTVRMFMVPIFVVLYLIFGKMYNIAAIIYAIAALTDALDGHLARSRNLVTTFGKFMDPLVDKILTMAGFILLTSSNIVPNWAVILIISRELIITGLRTLAASNNITIAASKGGKVKTLSQCISTVLLLLNNNTLNSIGLVIFYLAVILTVYSGIDYLVKNKKVLNLDDM